MASNKKKPMNKKSKKPVAKATKPVVAKKPTTKPVAKKPVTAKKPVVKRPTVVKPVETKVEQVSIADQIPGTICTCEKSVKKSHKVTYIVLGVIVVALLLGILF